MHILLQCEKKTLWEWGREVRETSWAYLWHPPQSNSDSFPSILGAATRPTPTPSTSLLSSYLHPQRRYNLMPHFLNQTSASLETRTEPWRQRPYVTHAPWRQADTLLKFWTPVHPRGRPLVSPRQPGATRMSRCLATSRTRQARPGTSASDRVCSSPEHVARSAGAWSSTWACYQAARTPMLEWNWIKPVSLRFSWDQGSRSRKLLPILRIKILLYAKSRKRCIQRTHKG